MRDILFRGKTKAVAGSPYNNGKPEGEWVKGYLYNDIGCWKIRQFETDYADYIPYEVDPETVGQYTGLTDKNDKKIFEGDIVKHYNHCEIKEYSEDTGRVFYYSETCRFLRTSKLFPDDCPEICSRREYEVIGNIHDNPELLKGGAD